MEQLVRLEAIAAPLMAVNIDTDQIIPGRFLLRVAADWLSRGLFADWRWRRDGSPDPEFILNQEPYSQAQILIADRNFGCGSSREPAATAIREFGIRAIIAPSFGDIFYTNCFRNGVLPVRLSPEAVQSIAEAVKLSNGRLTVSVDLESETVTAGSNAYAFETPARYRQMLLEGLDEVGLTFSRYSEIEAFRLEDRSKRSWAYEPSVGAPTMEQ